MARPCGRLRSASTYVPVYPGTLGGVETPMALAGGRVFVPWVDLATQTSATSSNGTDPLSEGRGGFTALDAATGAVLWQHRLPSMVFGAATVANDVVFTSTYDGTIHAFATATGRQLWKANARAGINSFPAIAGRTLLVGAAAPAFFEHPRFELIAYSLGNLLTYGPFLLQEPMNRGAVLCATIDASGRVGTARVESTVQRAPGVLVADWAARAAAIADSLARLDFPATGARVGPTGELRPRVQR